MISPLFLSCALASPVVNFTRAEMTDYNYIHDEIEQLKEWVRKRHPGAEVHIVNGDAPESLMKISGWEKLPFRWRDCQIWIRRKPSNDFPVSRSA